MQRARAEPAGRLRVLQSTPRPGPTTNPYVVQLHDELRAAGVDVVPFSWRSALLGRYDVLHTHWPEILVRGNGPARALGRQVLTTALVVRLALTRVPVVRTVHNLRPHEQPTGTARVVLAMLEGRERWWIRLNEHTPVREPARSSVALHGDYTAWAAGRDIPPSVPGRLVAPGVVRGYKGLEELVDAFSRMDDDAASLHVVGRADDVDLAHRLRRAAAADPRIRLTLRHVDDDELAAAVGEAQVAVLPYREIHNSGALLLALSLGRPVLVPRAPVTQELAERVGTSWVLTEDMSGPVALTAALTSALAGTRRPPADPVDLSAHDWGRIARVHVDAYRAARVG